MSSLAILQAATFSACSDSSAPAQGADSGAIVDASSDLGPSMPRDAGVVPVCAPPFRQCRQACVNTEFDTNNCGACDVACATGQSCLAGSCLGRSVDAAVADDAHIAARWVVTAPLGTARYGLSAATGADGRIYAIGGDAYEAPVNHVTNLIEGFAPATGAWTTLTSMPSARRLAAATRGPDGRIYVLGGASPGADRLATAEVYAPATGTWTSLPPMPTVRTASGAAAGSDGRIYAMGGFDGLAFLASVDAYSPSTNTWAACAPMPTPRVSLGVTAGLDGRIYAIGGLTGPTSPPTNVVEVYSPSTNTWATAAPMLSARAGLAVTTAADGRIFAIGGSSEPASGSILGLDLVEVYDPTTNIWTTSARLPFPRVEHAAATGADGRIYVIGGSTDGTGAPAESTVVVYTP